jgi:hypothetical protein
MLNMIIKGIGPAGIAIILAFVAFVIDNHRLGWLFLAVGVGLTAIQTFLRRK